MATHKLMVRVYMGGTMEKTGALVDYDGPPNWKFQPLNDVARAEWEKSTADPERVEENLRQSGEWDWGEPKPPAAGHLDLMQEATAVVKHARKGG